jgi:8-oxo-dGTP diphosphatase
VKKNLKTEITVNITVFGFDINEGIKVCLIRRLQEPFCKHWALPGGYLNEGETLAECAARELEYDTGIKALKLEQHKAFGASINNNNHVTISFYGLTNIKRNELFSMVEEKMANWFPVKKLPNIAFNQDLIIKDVFEHMRLNTTIRPIFKDFLPNTFTLTEVQRLLENIFDCSFDQSNFRKKIISSRIFVKTGRKRKGGSHRAPDLYKFTSKNFGMSMGHKLFGYTSFIGNLISNKFDN